MPGPHPKPAHLRQRQNKKSTYAVIPAGRRRGRMPELPERPCECLGKIIEQPKTGKRKRGRPPKPAPQCDVCLGTGVIPWHRLTVQWWKDTWTSATARKLIQIDRHGLFRLAVLVENFWRGQTSCANEIRLELANYGQTPLDRARLQWEIEEDGKQKTAEQEDEEEEPVVLDFREALRALK